MTFKGNSKVIFHGNVGGTTMSIADHSNITFEENSTVSFINNLALINDGGVMHIIFSAVTFKGNCRVKFYGNSLVSGGGTMHINDYSNITFEGNSTVIFGENEADNGGAVHSVFSAVSFKGNSKVIFLRIFVVLLCLLLTIPVSHLKKILQ